MTRPKKPIEVPGQETTPDDGNDLIGGTANTAAELNAATAGATVITETTTATSTDTTTDATVQQKVSELLDGTALAERNAILSTLPAAGLEIITRFEEYGFEDLAGRSLTNNLDFLDLVKRATTAPVATVARHGRAAAMVVNEDGAKRSPGKPVLTKDGWHVPE